FEPDRMELIKGPPASRRAHLDQVVAAIWPLRAADRLAYGRALVQRNALLGRIRSGRASSATLSAWDRELAVHALALRSHRAEAADLLAPPSPPPRPRLAAAGEPPPPTGPPAAAAAGGGFPAGLTRGWGAAPRP